MPQLLTRDEWLNDDSVDSSLSYTQYREAFNTNTVTTSNTTQILINSPKTQKVQKRQSKINYKMSIAKTTNGLRLTVISKRLGKMALRLNTKFTEYLDNGERIPTRLNTVITAINFRNESFDGSNRKVNKLMTSLGIPNMSFLKSDDIVTEIEIFDVFTDSEIEAWIQQFQVFVGKMKKCYKELDLIE